MSAKPLWRRVFDRAERAVGAPLENLVATREYADLLVVWIRLQAAVNRTVREALEAPVGAALHFVNLPAATDVRRLSSEIASLTSEMRRLSGSLDDELHHIASSIDEEFRGLVDRLDAVNREPAGVGAAGADEDGR